MMIKVPSSSRHATGKVNNDVLTAPDTKLPTSQQRSGMSNRTVPTADMTQCIKLMSEDMNRSVDISQFNDILTDNVGFLVVGAVGLQGSGKSTLLNCLADLNLDSTDRPFPVTDLDSLVSGLPATLGIDMFVTPDRVILLDTQPVLSLTLNEAFCNPNMKKKLWQNSNNSELSDIQPTFSPDNWSEMTSLMMLSFLLSVCHVVVVVEDYFTNIDLLHLINIASMIKPSIYTSKQSSMANNSNDLVSQEKEVIDYHPKIVFVQNKAPSPALLQSKLRSLRLVLSQAVSENRVNEIRERLWQNKLSRSSQEPEEKPITKDLEEACQGEEPKNSNDTDAKIIDELSKISQAQDKETQDDNKLSIPSNANVEISSVCSTQKETEQEAADIALASSSGIIATNHIDALKTSATKSNEKTGSETDWMKSKNNSEENLEVLTDQDLPDLFVLPLFNSNPGSSVTSSFPESMAELRKHIFSLSRHQMIKTSPTPFTEKRWMQFCKKMWETVSSSPLLSDYHRHLMPPELH